MIRPTLSHDRREEDPLAKARWFSALSLPERMDYFCQITDLILQNNPRIVDRKHARPPQPGVRILERP